MTQTDGLVPAKAVSVRDRPRPEYSPIGLRFGSLSVAPQVSVSEVHDDNVYATDEDEIADFITLVSGSLSVTRQAPVFPASIFGKFSSSSNSSRSSEDFTSWEGGGSFGYNAPQRTTVTLQGSVGESVESRSEPSTPASVSEPIGYHTGQAQFAAVHTLAFGEIKFNAALESLSFKEARLDGGGALSQAFRDRDTTTFELQVGVRAGGSSSLFLRGVYVDRNYTDDPVSGLERDSSSKALFTGASFDITNLMRGELGLGYQETDNAAASQGKQRTLAIRSNIDFFITQLVTLTLSAQRASGASDVAGSSSYIGTSFGASLDYEMRRNVILSTQVSHTKRDYSGIGESLSSRSAGVGVQWLLNRNLRVGLDYNFLHRSESEIDRSFSSNRLMASVRLAL